MTKLKLFRQSKGLSQERMARAIDVTLTTYSRVERGYSVASRAFIDKMKEQFSEIDINDMFFSDLKGVNNIGE